MMELVKEKEKDEEGDDEKDKKKAKAKKTAKEEEDEKRKKKEDEEETAKQEKEKKRKVEEKEEAKEEEEDEKKGGDDEEETVEDSSSSAETSEDGGSEASEEEEEEEGSGSSEEEDEHEDEDEVEKDLTMLLDDAADGSEKEDVKKKEEESKPKGKEENKDELKQAVEKGEEQFKHANSVTHKAEYDKFSRQCLDRKKFPVSLAPHYMKDKLDVFRAWLQASEQWDAVEVIYERRAERRSKSKKSRAALKARDLYHKYPKEKADGLMRKLKEKGMWYYDPDFDGDEEEIFYYACEGNVLSDESVFVESTTVKGKEVGNKELVEALTGEGGPLAAGAIAGAATATEAGQKALSEAMAGSNVTAAPKKPKKRMRLKRWNQRP